VFTLQISDLVRQTQGQVPDPVVSALESLLGNCAAKLEHRGPVSVQIDGNYLPSIFDAPRGGPIPTNCDGTAPAAVTAINRAGRFSGENCLTDCVDNGLAFRAIGPSHLDVARIDTLYVGELKDLCGEPIDAAGPGGAVASGALYRFLVTNESQGLGRIVKWNGTAYISDGADIKLMDFTPRLEFQSRWRNGYYGWCTRLSDRLTYESNSTTYQMYEVVWVESRARFLEFSLTAGISGGSATADVIRTWGADDHANPPTGITVFDRTNRMASAPVGTKGIAVWDEQTSQYVTLHSYYNTPVTGPSQEQLACIRISNGQANGSCLFSGDKVDINLSGTPDFCANTVWVNPVSVWVFAPNYEDSMPDDRYHFGMKLADSWSVNGVTKPLYLVKPCPDEVVVLKLNDAARRSDCVYAAQVVDFSSVTNYCEVSPIVTEDVFVYLPNSDPDCKMVSGLLYCWGKLISLDFNGKKLYFSSVDVRGCLALFAVVELSVPLDCDDKTGKAKYVSFTAQGTHREPWGEVGDTVEFQNKFSFCAPVGTVGLLLLNQRNGGQHILVQLQHTCTEIITGIEALSACTLNMTVWKTSVIKCSERNQAISLEQVICDCCG
jgi:hypothetical protein